MRFIQTLTSYTTNVNVALKADGTADTAPFSGGTFTARANGWYHICSFSRFRNTGNSNDVNILLVRKVVYSWILFDFIGKFNSYRLIWKRCHLWLENHWHMSWLLLVHREHHQCEAPVWRIQWLHWVNRLALQQVYYSHHCQLIKADMTNLYHWCVYGTI